MTRAGAAAPRLLLVPAVLAVVLVALPLIGLVSQVPWSRFVELVTTPEARTALGLSLRTCLVSTLVCVVLGAPLALVLGRSDSRAARWIRTGMTLPLVLPPVVAGIALLSTFGRAGLLGGTLEALGVRIAFSTIAVVLAQVFVSLPYLVISFEGAVRTAGHAYEDVAATLGARPSTVLRRVTLPLLGPALGSGTALAFARCLGEFGATLTFAGSLEGVTRTLPLQIYLEREISQDSAVALSVLLLGVAVLVLALSTWFAARGERTTPADRGELGDADDPASPVAEPARV